MATTTRVLYRQGFSESIGDFISVVTTAAGDASGLTIISDAFLGLDGGEDTGAFERMYALIADSSSSADGESRRISTYIVDPDGPAIRATQAFSAQIVSGITIEIHRYDPVDKHNVLGQALRQLSKDLALPIRDESIVVDNRLANTGFETFSSGFTGWTEVGSPTVTQETTIVRHGSSSAKVVASGAVGQLTQAPFINTDELVNEDAEHNRWVYATAANSARIRIDFGTSTAESAYHSGKDQWEYLEITQAIPDLATKVEAICEVADGFTGYFDIGHLSAGPVYEYDLPSNIVGDVYSIRQQANEDDVEGPFIPIHDGGRPFEGRILRVTGRGLLRVPTTDTGTTQIGEPQLQLVYAYAEMLLWRLMASPARSAAGDRQGYIDAGRDAANKVSILEAQKGMKTPRISAERHRLSWAVQGDGESRKIVFRQSRG